MAATVFTVRQFYTIPSEYGTFTGPSGVFIITGSISRLLVNDSRTNLANDSMTITTQFNSPYVASSGTSQGWWPGTLTAGGDTFGDPLIGTIVGGSDNFANTSPDGRTSEVSVWGFSSSFTGEGGTDQTNLNAAFIELTNSILGTSFTPPDDLGAAKTALRNAGFYYQYPVGFDGQSPRTGDGSDV